MKHSDENITIDSNLFKIEFGHHHNKEVIWLHFEYNTEVVNNLKKLAQAKWSVTHKLWYIADNTKNRALLNINPKIVGKSVIAKISEDNLQEFYKFQNVLVLKGFSKNTIRTYSIEFAQLLYALKNNRVVDLTSDKLQSYFLYCFNELNLSENLIHSRINAVKFYFEKVLHKEKMFFDIPRPKKQDKIPKTLTTKDIKKIFKIIDNPKHKLIIQLCYGMGLRVSEIINIKIEDVNSVDMRVHIEKAKGKKDRMVNLPESILEDLRSYYKDFRPKTYLFENKLGEQYSTRKWQCS